MLLKNDVVVFDRLIGLLSFLEQLGIIRMHWRVKKQPFKTYFEASHVADAARFIDSWDHSLHVSLLTTIFSVVHLSMPTLVGLFCYVEV